MIQLQGGYSAKPSIIKNHPQTLRTTVVRGTTHRKGVLHLQ